MTIPFKVWIASLAFPVVLFGCAKPQSFETAFQSAKQNVLTEAGSAYDRELGVTFASVPGIQRAMSVCLNQNPGETSLHGYFEIRGTHNYNLVLEPKGGLADCFSRVYEGHTVPAPPTTPYLNPFEFAVTR